MARLNSLSMSLCGAILLILALAPGIAAILLINMEKPIYKAGARQAKFELSSPMEEEEKKEELVMEAPEVVIESQSNEVRKDIKTETIIQEIPNPFNTWRGRSLSSLPDILNPDLQGEMPFPSAPFYDIDLNDDKKR